ncbi:homoserine kinase [Pseudoalteromonas sp. JBTF-M23]|uniref:Homoserine kinase n=1 Tax=Pseudoalteromonas caenipelagi TaxID=2726988 RepID=A0A849VLM3_9GAMM|nr:homoserine kinase [Pseudoalteromonas caenipelagi]NOU52581.1 homoserine kinase [Pseudoalteromonas caenipelagi]
MISIYAPASIGNFCVGFDSLGAALAPIDGTLLGDVVHIEHAEQDTFKCVGPYAAKLPTDAHENLSFQCLLHFRELIAPDMPAALLTLEKRLPIGSGLGSSACSVVATFVALDKYADTKLSQSQMIELMADFEGKVSGARHYDNITPCYLGGLQLTADLVPNKALALPVDELWYYVAAYPGFALNTAKARGVLPQSLTTHSAVEFAQRLSSYCVLLQSGRFDDALALMKDELAEPYRQSLIAGFSDAKAALPEYGAKLVSISGAGPTLFAICKTLEEAQQCQQWLEKNYINEQGFSHICKLDNLGTRAISQGVNL